MHITYIRFGVGSNHIWLDEVVCLGNENFIQDCQHNSFGQNDCSHQEDVGVRCQGNFLVLLIFWYERY